MYHINQGHAHANLTIRFPCLRQVTGNLNHTPWFQAFSDPEKWLLHSLSSLLFGDIVFLRNWNRYFMAELELISPQTSRISVLSDFFTRLKTNGSSWEGPRLVFSLYARLGSVY
ncbi:hypothetical protein BYT27DRAFT_6952825 [Phlegmacium glaucopus]|nr:hypothetical protein BYT27DRAFT_6952825 [Phlegmacium glaucopus]